MSNVSVLFAEDFNEVSKRFCGYNNLGFSYRTCDKDGSVILEELSKNPVDVVVMDFFMKSIDALGVLERLKRLNPLMSPAIIVLSSIENSTIKNEFIKKGADYYLNKSVKTEVLIAKIKEVRKNKEKNKNIRDSYGYFTESESIVTSYIHEICVPAHVKGYNYLRIAIKLGVEDLSLLNAMTTKLYPMIAKECDVTSASVERSIRNAIKIAWDRGSPDAFSKYFGYNSQIRKKRPTNAEFIARIADEIRVKYNVS